MRRQRTVYKQLATTFGGDISQFGFAKEMSPLWFDCKNNLLQQYVIMTGYKDGDEPRRIVLYVDNNGYKVYDERDSYYDTYTKDVELNKKQIKLCEEIVGIFKWLLENKIRCW